MQELAFYFAFYGKRGRVGQRGMLRNGQVVAAAPVGLAPIDGDRSQTVGRLPVEGWPSGTYELRIQVTGGGRELSRTAFLYAD